MNVQQCVSYDFIHHLKPNSRSIFCNCFLCTLSAVRAISVSVLSSSVIVFLSLNRCCSNTLWVQVRELSDNRFHLRKKNLDIPIAVPIGIALTSSTTSLTE